MKRKMFVVSAFEIHGGVAGLFDYGPSSCALKVNYCSVLPSGRFVLSMSQHMRRLLGH